MNVSRIVQVSSLSNGGQTVVYVMSRDQRIHDNHALLAAQADALIRRVPLVVLFNLRIPSGVRSREQFTFMLDGLVDVASKLQQLHIHWVMRSGNATVSIQALLQQANAASVYFDFSPLTGPRNTVKRVASQFSGSVYVVDTHNIIPVWELSDKQEFAAHTIRRKIHRQLTAYLTEPEMTVKHPYDNTTLLESISFDKAYKLIQSISPSGIELAYKSGEKAATDCLDMFLESELATYATLRNDIAHDHQSGLSPYLHFGQISSLRVALETMKTVNQIPLLLEEARMAHASDIPSAYDGINALFEELIVRKELADNFCYYSPNYKSLISAHGWAQKTLEEHRYDPREFIYTSDEWEFSKTHDLSWNAAQNQLRSTGKMHGYMRMYWAKKILEWSANPEDALQICIYLNDKYSIDGGDPNGYAGILWSIAGVHDRAWFERPVFGKIRYMNAGGLKRKFDIDLYINQWT